jgi:hypothetical protein
MNHAKTFAAIDKLKEIEAELHRLKNALELANRALEAEREAIAQKFDGPVWSYDYREIAAAIRARGQE